MSEETALARWGSYDEDEAKRDKKETERKGTFFKITKEKTRLRFLPPKQGVKNPFIKTWQHFVALVEGDDRSTVVYNCPRKMMKAACPLCAMADAKKNTNIKADRDRAYELYPKFRVYAAIIDRADPDKGVQIYPFGVKILDQLTNIREDGDFTNPTEKGFDIGIFKKGSKKNDIEYSVTAARNGSPLSADPEEFNDWIDSLPDLTQYAYVPSREEIDEKLNAAYDAAEAEDDQEQPQRRLPADNGRGRERGGRERGRSETRETRGDDRGRGGRERPIETTGETVADDDDMWANDKEEDDIPY